MTGFFVVIEGSDGVGKTTIRKELQKKIEALNLKDQWVFTREPGGTEFAEKVRELLFSNDLTPFSEVMLLQAARDDHMKNVIQPALEAGKIVVCDRFIQSTWAYNLLPIMTEANEHQAKFLSEVFNYTNAYMLMGIGEPFTVVVSCDKETQLKRFEESGKSNKLDKRFLDNLETINHFYNEQSTTPNCYRLNNDREISVVVDELFDKIIEQKNHFDKHRIEQEKIFDATKETVDNRDTDNTEPEAKGPKYTMDEVKVMVKEQALTPQFVGSLKEDIKFVEEIFDYYIDKIEQVLNAHEDTLLNGNGIPQLVQQIQHLVYFGHQFNDLKEDFLKKEIVENQDRE